MSGYIAFYAGKQTEVRAASLYAAKLAAVAFFKPRKYPCISAKPAEAGQ